MAKPRIEMDAAALAALKSAQEHLASCATCSNGPPCVDGARLQINWVEAKDKILFRDGVAIDGPVWGAAS